jgi:hypothetical protein
MSPSFLPDTVPPAESRSEPPFGEQPSSGPPAPVYRPAKPRRVRAIWSCAGLSLLPAPVMVLLPETWAAVPSVGRWATLGVSGILMVVVVVLILTGESDAA